MFSGFDMSDLSKSFRSSAPTREEPKTISHEEWWKPNKHDRKVLTTLGIYTGAGLVFFFGAVAAVRLQEARQATTTHTTGSALTCCSTVSDPATAAAIRDVINHTGAFDVSPQGPR